MFDFSCSSLTWNKFFTTGVECSLQQHPHRNTEMSKMLPKLGVFKSSSAV